MCFSRWLLRMLSCAVNSTPSTVAHVPGGGKAPPVRCLIDLPGGWYPRAPMTPIEADPSGAKKPASGETKSVRVASSDVIKKEGSSDPKVVLSLYEDFLCPHCKDYVETVEPQLDQAYFTKPNSKAKLQFKNFIIFGQPSAIEANAAWFDQHGVQVGDQADVSQAIARSSVFGGSDGAPVSH